MSNLTTQDELHRAEFIALTFEQLCARGAQWLEQLQANGVPNEEIVMWLFHLGFDWKREQSTTEFDRMAAQVQAARKAATTE